MDEPATKPKAEELPDVQVIRWSLLNEQYCTRLTKRGLAEHILNKLIRQVGSFMGYRYSVEYVEEQLSEPVQCDNYPDRQHYLFDASKFSYLD